jgi:predicted DNA-binding transcriptional regulator YafY
MPRRSSSALIKARRLAALPELLRLKPRTTSELARHFGVPVRTVQRDLRTLRESGEVIEQPRRGLYRLPAAATALNPVEALAVHAATRLLHHHAPARNPHYVSALEKLAAMLPEPARTVALASTEELHARPGDDRALELAAIAWFEGRVLAFEYRSQRGSGRWRKNELEVYFIEVSRDNLAPYAIGFERTFHKRVLTFKLSRMRHARLLDERYTIPDDFDPRAYLSGAWGIMGISGGPIVKVRLRFAPEAAHRVREGGYPNLHVTAELPRGGLEVMVQAGTDDQGFPREILPWVQSWGPRVEVLEPEALRRRWLDEARQVAVRATADTTR